MHVLEILVPVECMHHNLMEGLAAAPGRVQESNLGLTERDLLNNY